MHFLCSGVEVWDAHAECTLILRCYAHSGRHRGRSLASLGMTLRLSERLHWGSLHWVVPLRICLCYTPGPMREKRYYVYILTNRSKTLYVGFTGNLDRRMWQHKNHVLAGFTDRYLIDRLVWFETFGDVHAAIAREKQIKAWTRGKKMALVVASNPTWRDLSEDWGRPISLAAGKKAQRAVSS